MKNTAVNRFILLFLVILQQTAVSQDLVASDDEIKAKITGYRAYRTCGAVSMVCGIVLGTAAVITANVYEPDYPSWEPDPKIQHVVGVMIAIAIPSTIAGLCMNLWGSHKIKVFEKKDAENRLMKLIEGDARKNNTDGNSGRFIDTLSNTNDGGGKRINITGKNQVEIGSDLLQQLKMDIYRTEMSAKDSLHCIQGGKAASVKE